jgi:uncharacterized phage protein (TIGR01671 family)
MSRELKFRVWNHTEGHWNGMRCKDVQSCGDLICLNGIYLIPESVSRNHTVQQYTGLQDKNGVEIYEGDIIHYKFNGDSYPKEAVDRILTCSYDEDEGMYSFDDSDHSYYWAEIKRHCNIIGNIYEKPELLKQ